MNRLIAILLMPLLVVGNSLAHSHSSAAHQSPGEGRAHFHVRSAPQHGHRNHDSHEHANHDHHGHDHHGHDHHGHDHERNDPESAPVAPVEHDEDAVYVVAGDFVYTACERISIEIASYSFVAAAACLITDFRPSVLRDRPPLTTPPQLPLYLLHAALRL
jgi:hypothetical protein